MDKENDMLSQCGEVRTSVVNLLKRNREGAKADDGMLVLISFAWDLQNGIKFSPMVE